MTALPERPGTSTARSLYNLRSDALSRRGGCMRRPTGLLAVAALAFVGIGEGLAAEPSAPASLGFRGHVLLKNFSYFEKAPGEDDRFRNEGIFQLEWARQFSRWASIKLVGDARADDDDLTEDIRFQIPDTARERSHLNLVEAVLRLGPDPLQLALGKQIYAWGTADAYNPTDNINPYDYLDPIDNEKMAVYSAALQGTLGPSTVTVVGIPVFTPSRVPLPSSRWVPAPPAEPTPVIADRQLPSTSLENIQWAVRVRTTLRGWDVALSYFEGFEDTPVFRQSIAQPTPGVTVPQFTPVFTRLRAPGLDFSTTYRKFEFHGEFAAKFVESDGAEDRVQGIVGFNYTWDEFGLAWLEQINAVLEYAREESLETVDPTILSGSAATLAALPNNAFRNALVSRLRFKFTENTEFKLSGTADFTGTLNHYVQAKLNHKFTDWLHLETGLDFFTGASDTFWGRWADNDRFFASLKLLF